MYAQRDLSGNILVENGELQTAENNAWSDNLSITINENASYCSYGKSTDQFGNIGGAGTLNLYRDSDASDSWIRVGADNANTEFSGLIKGAGSLGKTGTGTMTISGANTFTGRAWVEQGTMSLTNPLALQKSTVELSSRFDLNGLDHTFGGISGGGNFTMSDNSILTVGKNNKDTTYSGVLSGNEASLAKTGNGTLTLTKDNTYTGGTVLNGGALAISEKSQINLSSSNKLTFDGGILRVNGDEFGTLYNDQFVWGAGGGGFYIEYLENYFSVSKSLTGGGKLTKQGGGYLILTGDNSAMSGDVHVQRGTLQLRHYRPGQVNYTSEQNRIGDTSLVTIDSGATILFDFSKPFERIGALAGGGAIDLGTDGEIIVGDARTTEFSGILMGDIEDEGDVSGKLTKVGTGTLTLSGNNRHNRGTEIREGTLSIGKSSNLSIFSDNPLIFSGGMLQITGANIASINHPITWGNNGVGFDIVEATHTLTVSDAVTGNGGLIKRGAGTLALTGNNTYQGDTIIESGTLQLTGSNGSGTEKIEIRNNATLRAGINNSLGGSTHVQVDEGGSFIVEGGEDFARLSGAGNVYLNSHNIAFGFDDADATFSGTISGSGIIKKYGTGVQLFSGANTSTGGAIVYEGTLNLTGDNENLVGTIAVRDRAVLRAGAGDSLGDQTRVEVNAGGVFKMDGNERFGSLSGSGTANRDGHELNVGTDDSDTTFSGTMLTSGSLVKSGTGTMTLSGDDSLAGSATISGGALRLTGNNGGWDATVTVRDGATLRAGQSDSLGLQTHVVLQAGGTFIMEDGEAFGSVSGGGDIETEGHDLGVTHDDDNVFSGSLKGSGSFYKHGTGTLTFSGDNSAHTGPLVITDGLVDITDGTFKCSELLVGHDAQAALNISGATLRATSTTRFGRDAGASGNVEIGADSSLTFDSYLVVAYAGTAQVDQNAGSVLVDNNMPLYIGERSDSDGTYNLNAGSLHVTGDLCIGGNSGSAGGEGILTVGESAILTVDGELKLWSGGTLDGKGSLAANVTNAGTLAPGQSPGLMTIDGDYTQDAAATLEIELAGLMRGSEYDALVITGAATLGGTLEVKLLGGFAPANGDRFDILDWASRNGGSEFDTLILPLLDADQYWDISDLYTDGEIAAAPEPATMSLLALGGLAMLRRRRRSA
ncbi:MAG: PEP-CTERM sorting domain-containing protein [Phycisphaerales bacterium]|nr:PEP-CTERM sorting domain-containing protein [Phycisphaerales bacterium]